MLLAEEDDSDVRAESLRGRCATTFVDRIGDGLGDGLGSDGIGDGEAVAVPDVAINVATDELFCGELPFRVVVVPEFRKEALFEIFGSIIFLHSFNIS